MRFLLNQNRTAMIEMSTVSRISWRKVADSSGKITYTLTAEIKDREEWLGNYCTEAEAKYALQDILCEIDLVRTCSCTECEPLPLSDTTKKRK